MRDYKTGEYVGGDPDCDHRHGNQAPDNKHKDAITAGVRPGSDFSTCILCGATRVDQQIGIESVHDCKAWAMAMEPCGECYVCAMRMVGMEIWRVMKDTGTWWLNLGDSYNGYPGNAVRGSSISEKNQHARQAKPTGYGLAASGLKPKDLMGIPWLVALALQADGWTLRRDIIWQKPNCMPESVKDRPTTAHEYIFLLVKDSRNYYYDQDAIREPLKEESKKRWKGQKELSDQKRSKPGVYQSDGVNTLHKIKAGDILNHKGRNKRSVWTVNVASYRGSHFATWPPDLVRPMVMAGCPPGGLVLDPFAGSGTTGLVSRELGRSFIGLDLSLDYLRDQAMVRLGLADKAAWEHGHGRHGKGLRFDDLPLFEQG